MRTKAFAIILTLLLSTPGLSFAQQAMTTTTAPSAATLLAEAAAALSGSVTVSDVTLTGTVQSTAGSDTETGTVSMKAMAPGESRLDLTLSASSHSEIRTFDDNGNLVGAWSGSDGVQHPIAFHNMLTDSSWFFPALTLSRIVADTTTVGTYVGQETLNGQSVFHVSVLRPPAVSRATAAAEHFTQMELYLDPTTFLPVALSFNTHPDDNALLDIPMQILFSNYQVVSGVQIPFHVQRFFNNSLLLDMQLQSAVLNSGLTPGGFGVQASQ
jgi:hypothetical protein